MSPLTWISGNTAHKQEQPWKLIPDGLLNSSELHMSKENCHSLRWDWIRDIKFESSYLIMELLRYGLDDRGSIHVTSNEGEFLFATASRAVLEPTQQYSRGRVAGAWSWTLTSTRSPQYVFVAWYVVKHRYNFTF